MFSRSTTARRIVGAFGAVLLLFGLALVVIVVALGRIADAEREVNRLDHAKHAGHHAAALAISCERCAVARWASAATSS